MNTIDTEISHSSEENKLRNKASYQEGLVSIIINTSLFVLKLWAGIVSGSIALTADAWHTLSDSLSSIMVILGAKLSSKKPDKNHPFGHGRWEQLASIFIGVLLAIIAYDFLKSSVVQFNAKESANFGVIALVVTIVSIIIKEGLAQYAFYLGRKTNNLLVKADGWHHRTDALSSVVVLVGILVKDYFWWIDSALGAIIALMLFYTAYQIIKEAIDKLLGEEPSEEFIKEVERIINSTSEQEIHPHHFHIHNYVSHQELTFHIKLDNEMDLFSAHEIATKIEHQIFDELNVMATVHLEPRSFDHRFD